jgi:prepilin-type processing-associated H-X9-DG protein
MTTPTQPTTAVQTAPLAIWSLVLGIVGLLCCGLFSGIPAVICGHMAQSRIKQSGGTLGGGGLAIGGLVTGYIGIVLTSIMVIGIFSAVTLPAFVKARERAYQNACMNNLKQIGVSMQMYANENQEKFPSDFQSLVPKYVPAVQVTLFVCPATRHQPGDASNLIAWTDYVLVANRKTSDSPDTVLAFSKPDCYHGRGGNVLFVDGHVQWCDKAEYDRLTSGL